MFGSKAFVNELERDTGLADTSVTDYYVFEEVGEGHGRLEVSLGNY